MSIESASGNWRQITAGLGSLVTVPQVLLAGYAAQRIHLHLEEAISYHHSPLIDASERLLGSYLEEYGEPDPAERDKNAAIWLIELFAYVEKTVRLHWIAVDRLATALLHVKTLSEVQASEIIEQAIPEAAKTKARMTLDVRNNRFT